MIQRRWRWGGVAIAVGVVGMVGAAQALEESGFEALHAFSRVLHNITQYYVESVDEGRLIEGAMQGMLESLDPHSAYLPPKYYKALRSETGGRFTGVGIEVTVRRGWLTVVSPIDGTPAARAGIKAGDRIVKINGQSTKQIEVGEAVELMRGREGSRVVLTIQRPGNRVPFDVSLRRERVTAPSVRAELAAPGYPYVRITGFQERTFDDLLAGLRQVGGQGKIEGLILDLRNNPGGLLEQAVAISDLFLRSGVILTTVSRGQEIDRRTANADGTEPGYPIAILVNGGSASAAEIVSGALQDHRRALIVGSQTFGKGSVQTVIELDNGGALKLTVARYYTPSKRSIQAYGIPPDVVVPEEAPGQVRAREPEEEAVAGENNSEANLPRHLEARGGHHEKSPTRGRVAIPTVQMAPGDTDYQRAVALALLRNGTVAKLTNEKQ